MPTFVTFLNWTEQGAKSVKDSPNRAEASKALYKKLGGEVKQLYMMSGDHDAMIIADVPDGDVAAKFALALSSQGNVKTTTARLWSEKDMQKIINGLP